MKIVICLLFFFKENSIINVRLHSRYASVAFLWNGFNCFKVTEPLRGDSLLFTIQSPGLPGTHLVDLA